ncbi:KH homology domain-containing protein 4-like [Osmerus mordax]|uniref:KH homology domain-containing protein 4-like n=1 Tax=Osmerus mordax TaxID=8014 RepID=UPI003510380D
MSSGMTGQTPCVTTSRWDQPAQPKPRVDVMQACVGNSSHPSVPASCMSVTNQNATQNRGPGALRSDGDQTASQGGVEMAAAMAAKINAMLMAKGKLKIPPPLPSKVPSCLSVSSTADETVVTEVDINDVPINCRNLLTKGKTQEEIRQCSGAVVSTKGHYMSDMDKGKAVERPLYLHVQGRSQDEVNKAVRRIKEIISEDVLRTAAALGGQQVPIIPPLTLYPQPSRTSSAPHMPRTPSSSSSTPQGHRPAAPHSGSFVHTKIFVGLDQALPSFNVNEKVEGPGGTYLGHIQTETGARVFLRGKSSGYIEQASRRESFEPLYVYISHPNQTGLESAKKLTESLLETVRAEHSQMVSIYTATGSTQPYAAHGYPPNSNYSSQGSWYSYPANGYAGGYSPYPGSSGYWSSANGAPSHSNLSTTPQSSQAMVQYPVCPRKPHPYLVQDPGSTDSEADEGSSTSPPQTGSPKRRFQEEAQDELASQPADVPAAESSPPTAPSRVEEGAERMLMPPPPPMPPVFAAPPARKRAREPVSLPPSPPSTLEAPEEESVKKPRVVPDASGLVPYGGDSSDEEEERTRSSKMV